MAIHSKTISISASAGLCMPKKIKDQRVLRASWIMNATSATCTRPSVRPLRHTKNAAMPISKNSTVHTGPNAQSGGVYAGHVSDAYHLPISGAVKSAPMPPAACGTKIATAKRNQSFIRSVIFIVYIWKNYARGA